MLNRYGRKRFFYVWRIRSLTVAARISISSNRGSSIPFFITPHSVAIRWISGEYPCSDIFFLPQQSEHPSRITIRSDWERALARSSGSVLADMWRSINPKHRQISISPALAVVFPVFDIPEQVIRVIPVSECIKKIMSSYRCSCNHNRELSSPCLTQGSFRLLSRLQILLSQPVQK